MGFLRYSLYTEADSRSPIKKRADAAEVLRMRARERSERASAGAGARKKKCVETLVYKGILYYPTLKSRCDITVSHLFPAKTVQFRDQKRCNLCRGVI